MGTRALIQSVLHDPYMTQFTAYNRGQDIANLEILLAHDIYEYGCSAQPMDSRKAWDELVRTANARIRAEREKNPNAYDMDGFYWYYSMNPEATDALHADNGAVAVLLQELAGEA